VFQGNTDLSDVTHVVVDEVHERTILVCTRIYFFVKLQNVIVVPMLDDIFKRHLFPSSRVTSCLLFLRVLLRDALINKEGS
jgi:hypothetical protein